MQTQWQWSVREDPDDDDAAAAAFAAEIFLSTEAAEAALARRNLIVPSGRLPGGKSAHFTFEAWYENAPDRKAESVATVTVRAQKLVAAIRGGSRLVGASAQVEIDGSASRDPDDAAADLGYAWSVAKVVGADGVVLSPPATVKTGLTGQDTSKLVILADTLQPGAEYLASLEVSSLDVDDRARRRRRR